MWEWKSEEIYLIDETFKHRRPVRPSTWQLERFPRQTYLAHLENLNILSLLRLANLPTAGQSIVLRLDIPS